MADPFRSLFNEVEQNHSEAVYDALSSRLPGVGSDHSSPGDWFFEIDRNGKYQDEVPETGDLSVLVEVPTSVSPEGREFMTAEAASIHFTIEFDVERVEGPMGTEVQENASLASVTVEVDEDEIERLLDVGVFPENE